MALAPMISQTAMSQAGEPSDLAIPAGVRKIPTPMTSPTTIAVAVARPSRRQPEAPYRSCHLRVFRDSPGASEDPRENLDRSSGICIGPSARLPWAGVDGTRAGLCCDVRLPHGRGRR